MRPALIIFQKNSIPGQVKTRLAATLGKKKALEVYNDLVEITVKNCEEIQSKVDLHVYYGASIPDKSAWKKVEHTAHIQNQSNDLGKRMKHAFEELWEMGYRQLMIIGVDCPYISSDLLEFAFKELISKDLVIGPAKDGGFYLLGIRSLRSLDFDNITWSTSSVLKRMLANPGLQDLDRSLLATLEDIDEEECYNRYLNYVNSLNYN